MGHPAGPLAFTWRACACSRGSDGGIALRGLLARLNGPGPDRMKGLWAASKSKSSGMLEDKEVKAHADKKEKGSTGLIGLKESMGSAIPKEMVDRCRAKG